MIVGWLLGLVATVVGFFQGLLPSVTVPSWFTSDNFGSGLATSLGGLLAPLNNVLPIDALLSVLEALLLLLPVIVAYEAFQWAWNHVPSIFGFGTH
jgi:hypothetical protein